MKKIYKVGRKYFDRVLQGDTDALRQIFTYRKELWADPNYEREVRANWIFSDLSCKLRGERAFSLIPEAVKLVLEQETAAETECSLWLIWQLVECSGTTELPKALEDNLPAIKNVSSLHGDETSIALSEILRHYRIKLG